MEAGGFENELQQVIEDVEAAREDQLRQALGRAARSRIIGEIKAEILRRFEELHPGVKVRFYTGPYRDPNERSGPARRIR